MEVKQFLISNNLYSSLFYHLTKIVWFLAAQWSQNIKNIFVFLL